MPLAYRSLPPEMKVRKRGRIDVREVEPPRDEPRDRVLRRGATAAASPYVPRSAMPTEPVLNPSACAPTTFRSIPPKRPS